MKTSRGFAPIILIIVISLAVLGGVGWWVNQEDTVDSVDSNPDTVTSPVNEAPVESQKTYSTHPLIKAYLQGPSEITTGTEWKGTIIIPQNTIGVAGAPDVMWGDGSADPEFGGSPWSYDANGNATITHTYTKPGNYSITIYINGGADVGFEKGTVVINKAIAVQ